VDEGAAELVDAGGSPFSLERVGFALCLVDLVELGVWERSEGVSVCNCNEDGSARTKSFCSSRTA